MTTDDTSTVYTVPAPVPMTTFTGAPTRDPTQVLKPFVEDGAMAGAMTLVAGVEGVRFHGAVGYADLATRRPVAPGTCYWIASMTKPMTATAVMMLVDEGRIALDDPIERHLPDFEGQMLVLEDSPERVVLVKPDRVITLRDVMSHTSGLPFLSRPERGKIDRLSLKEAAVTYAMTPLTFQPGSKYEYSNVGINVAGRIIEVTTGQKYEDFMQQRLLSPLGMDDTTMWPNKEQQTRLATAYAPAKDGSGLVKRDAEFFTFPLEDRKRGPCPGGGYFSTAADVSAFCRMILGGGQFEGTRFLSEAAVREMTRKQTGDLETSYGLGWGVAADGTGFGHGGAAATDMWIDPAKGIAMIYLVQLQGYAGTDGANILPAFHAAARAL